MFIVIVWLTVKADWLEAFLVATLEMGHASLKENGCRRFEVIRSEHDPTRFLMYKAFSSRADAEAHLTTVHVQHWQTLVAPMLREASRAETFTQLF